MSKVKAKVDIYLGDTLVKTCTCSDVLQDFKITRVGDTSKFFGFGVVHKLDVEFIDLYKVLEISKENTLKIYFGDDDFIKPFPTFYVNEVTINQKDFTISVTAYDKLYGAQRVTLSEVGINPPYTVRGLAEGCASYLGWNISIPQLPDYPFGTHYPDGGNFSGEETLTEVFTAISEVTQTIYYVDVNDILTYKRLDKTGEPVLTVTKDNYYELNTTTSRTLTGICSTTELGDNLDSTVSEGTTQYVRNNPLWELREDRAHLLDIAINEVNGLTINQFYCDWAGNFLLEIGDKIAFATDGTETITAYLLSDILTFNGYLSEITDWDYSADEDETDSNPTSIGAKVLQTSAKVDKVNQTIELVAADVSTNSSNISQLQIDTQGITASVSAISSNVSVIEGKANTLENDTKALQTTAQVLQTGLSNANKDIESVNTDLSEYKTANDAVVSALDTDVENMSKTVSTHTSQISSLEVTTQGITASVSNQATSITNIEASVKDLDGEVTTVKNSVTSQDTKIATLETNLNGISASVSSQNSTISTLQTTVSSQGTDIDTLESDVDTLKTKTETLTTTTETHTTQIGSLQTTTESISATVSSHTTSITSLETTTEGLLSKVEENTAKVGELEVTTESITGTVSQVQETTSTTLENLSSDIEKLTQEVVTKVTAEDVSITVKNEIENGVTNVTTTTGFTFNEDGLTVSKSGREMKTQITEDGMTVFRDTTPVLTANSAGVDAKNLNASTYLVIGTNSRFEDYQEERTACFWIGG